jgi:hypothetical protein
MANSLYVQRPTWPEGEGSEEADLRPLAQFFLRRFLGLQNLGLTAMGVRHTQVSLRDFDIVADRAMRSALSACLRKTLVSFTIVRLGREAAPA